MPEKSTDSMGSNSALVVEGGAMRGIFAAGVLDRFLDDVFNPFDLCIGVSAGANNLSGFLANMRGRNYTIYTDYSRRPEFINMSRVFTGGNPMDIDWLWETTIREIPLDTAVVERASQDFLVGVTRVADGAAVFIRPTGDTLAEALKASSAMPLMYRSFVTLDGVDYADGGIANPIPVDEALRRGASRVIVVRSRPKTFRMDLRKGSRLMRLSLTSQPALRDCLGRRPERYNRAIDLIRNPPPGVEIIEVNPPEEFESSRTTRDLDKLDRDYERGIDAGGAAIERWNERAR